MDRKRRIPADRSAGENSLRISEAKLRSLEELLHNTAPGIIAVSGGLDSRLLAFLAASCGEEFLCVHFCGAHIPFHETASARRWLDACSLPFACIEVDIFGVEPVVTNSADRCYHCKKHMFSRLIEQYPGKAVCDGTNYSDLGEYRPGLTALRELGVVSPFALCGISKDEIKALAHQVGLDYPDQPSTPCLLTRFPYGYRIDKGDVRRVSEIESQVRSAGFSCFRVRLVDGIPTLFAHVSHKHQPVPHGLAVQWVDQVSGHWDRTS